MAHVLACFRSGEELPSKYLQKNPYNAGYERKRREACRAVMEMSMEEEWRDDAILREAERVEARRLEGATITPIGSGDDEVSDVSLDQALNGYEQLESMPLHDAEGRPWRPEPGIYLRGIDTRKIVPVASKASEQKVMRDFSVDTCFPTVCTTKLVKAWIDLRKDVATLARLRELVESDATKNTDQAA